MKPKKRNERSFTASTLGKWTTLTVVLVVLLGTASFGFGQGSSLSTWDKGGSSVSSPLSPELSAILAGLKNRSSNQRLDVIVQFKHSPSDSRIQTVKALGGVLRHRLNVIRGALFNLSVNEIRMLAKDPEIAYISPNRALDGASDYTEATVGADVAQSYGWDGAGVTVAVIDSGISNRPDLRNPVTGQSRVVYNESFVPGTNASDQYGHGRHVAGILAGNGTQSGGLSNPAKIYGVAPSVKLVNLKVLDVNGRGQDSYVVAALQRAIALKDAYGIRIVNLSLGRPVFESYTQDPLCQAVEAAWQAGLIVVVAAGNSGRKNDYGLHGYGTIAAPGNDPYVITVGAMNAKNTANPADDVIASYSSKGPTMLDHVVKPDLVAPGNRIASLLVPGSTLDLKLPTNEVSPTTYGGYFWSPKSYFILSGTSMATPVVSGAAALMLEQNGSLTPDLVKARLMKTADKVFPVSSKLAVGNVIEDYQYDIFTVGAGYLDILGALGNSDAVTGTALSPIAVRDASGTVSLVADASSVWSKSVVWGNSVIWGSSVIWGNGLVSGTSVIWGNSVVWGNATLDGCSVIWGNSVIWGSTVGASDAGNDALSVDGNGDDDLVL